LGRRFFSDCQLALLIDPSVELGGAGLMVESIDFENGHLQVIHLVVNGDHWVLVGLGHRATGATCRYKIG